ncbi:MAG: DUF2079 domain-containing protein [Ardenticatenaceae bacterium]|nr:DUF2079 domain-containing protein [Anaerolineales bacterium]MCB9009655.1 DUF2079 domain-containing protein [Ardenticatenaceae bacterium]
MTRSFTEKTQKQWLPALILGGLVLFVFIEMSALSLAKFAGFNSKYFDLGAMSQAIWSATQGEPLIFTGQGIAISRLTRNVELIYFAIAPIYALLPTPQTLLVIQALLYALGGIPLYRLANRKLQHSAYALVVTAIYLFYPVAQTAVLAEFHSDTLAAPFLLFAIAAADRKAWRSYGFWLALALSCKFYVAAPVAALGAVLWLKGERRAGLITSLAAVGYGLIAFFAIRAAFAPPAAEVAQAVNVQSSALGYLTSRFNLPFIAQTLTLRLVHAVIVLMPALLLLAWRAPLWLLPAAVTVLPALLSSDFGPSFSYRTHHYALAAPFLVTAVLYGTIKQLNDPVPKGKKPAWQGRLRLTLFMVLAFNLAFIDTPISPQFYLDRPALDQGLSSTRFGVIPRDRFKADWLAGNVPAHVPLAADQLSAVRLANREVLYLTNYVDGRSLTELLPQVDYVVTDALYDAATADPVDTERIFEGGVSYEYETILTMLGQAEFKLLAMQDGLLLFGRTGEGLATSQAPGGSEPPGSSPIHLFNEIALLDYKIEPVGANRYQITATWQLTTPLDAAPNRFAVTQIAGLPNTRLVHLPVSILAPPKSWAIGDTFTESFEFALPADTPVGSYTLSVGWYDADHIFAAHTDARSRLGEAASVGAITVLGD